MTIEKKLELLADILDVDASDLDPATDLADIPEWDSIASLSFIAMMDEEFGKEIKGADIKGFKTLQDALNMMEE